MSPSRGNLKSLRVFGSMANMLNGEKISETSKEEIVMSVLCERKAQHISTATPQQFLFRRRTEEELHHRFPT